MEPILEEEELAALRAAMGSAVAAPPAGGPTAFEATPIALIAEDRAASQARPNGLRLLTRFARSARKLLTRHGIKAEVAVAGVETVDATALRDELLTAWTQPVGAEGRPGALLVAVSGPIIEALAARLLGAPIAGPGDPNRAPSPVAMSLFRPAGEALSRGAAEAWEEEHGCAAAPITDATKFARAIAEITSGVAVLGTLVIHGGVSGWLRLLARPETLLAPRAAEETVAVPPRVIQEILGAVPVELSVELGRARMTMAELAAITPGCVVALDRFIDDLLPVRCQGVIKAHGRAVVARNAMAVEIASSKEREPA